MPLAFASPAPLVPARAARATCALAVRRAAAPPAPAPARRSPTMQVGGGREGAPAGEAVSESLLQGGGIAVLDDGEDEVMEGEVAVLAPPAAYLNAAAVVAAREKFRRHAVDTGSPEYQIATLTTKINYLTGHLKKHPKDFSSTRGLLAMVSTRRRLLKYLKKEDAARFSAILEGMNIRVNLELRAM